MREIIDDAEFVVRSYQRTPCAQIEFSVLRLTRLGRLHASDIATLGALLYWAEGQAAAWAPVKIGTLARQLGVRKVHTVYASLNRLLDCHVIERESRAGEPSLYRVMPYTEWRLPPLDNVEWEGLPDRAVDALRYALQSERPRDDEEVL